MIKSRKEKQLELTRSRIKRLNEIAIEHGWANWSAYETSVLNGLCAPTERAADGLQAHASLCNVHIGKSCNCGEGWKRRR